MWQQLVDHVEPFGGRYLRLKDWSEKWRLLRLVTSTATSGHWMDDLLGKISKEIGSGDTVVFLGDYIDRGPDRKGCVQRILDFRRTTQIQVVALLGNHDQWMLQTYHDYSRHSWLLGMEAFPTIQSSECDQIA